MRRWKQICFKVSGRQDDPHWADWSIRQLRGQSQLHELTINPIIYAELSLMYESVEALGEMLSSMEIGFRETPQAALFLAGKAFARYRREGGAKQNVLPDFFLGAHAAVAGCGILTRDVRRYRSYFPTVQLLTPETTGPARS